MSANLHKALEQYNQGLFEDAKLTLAGTLQKAPLDHNACHLCAMISNKLGQFDDALNYSDAALSVDRNNHEIWNTKGNILSNSGYEEDATRSFQKSLSLNPNYKPAQQNLAFLLNKLQDPLAALKLFEKLMQKQPNKASYIIGKAQALIMSERATEALNYLERVSINLPDDLAAYTKAQALFAEGHYTDALKAYKSIPESSNLYPQVTRNIFQILHLTGRGNDLNNVLDAESEQSPKGEIASINVEMVEKLHGGGKAKAYASSKYPQHHSSPFMLSVLARIDITNAAYSDAFEKTNRALKLVPSHAAVLAQNVTAAMGLGEYSHAKAIIDQQSKLMPNNQYWLAMRATLQRLMGAVHSDLYNYPQFVKAFDLPTPHGYSSQKSYLSALKASLLDLHEYEAAPLDQSLRLGTQTRANLVHLDIPEIRAFFTSINTCIQDYIEELPHDLKHPFLRRKTENPRVISAWSVKLTGTGFHVNHVHPEGWISSAFYVDVPEGIEQELDKKGWIKFGEPSFDIPGLNAEHFIAPAPGKLVLFPSYMWHGTVPTEEKTLRLTLPFDVLPV